MTIIIEVERIFSKIILVTGVSRHSFRIAQFNRYTIVPEKIRLSWFHIEIFHYQLA